MNEIKNILPIEIINQILRDFVDELEKEPESNDATASERYLKNSSYTELIKLRLLGKNWSKAVVQFYFKSITIKTSRYARSIIDNWNDDLFKPCFSCPVERLSFSQVYYSLEEELGKVDEDGDQAGYTMSQTEVSTAVSMNQCSRLIELLGMNLKTLHIRFNNSMGASSNLIKAIKNIRDLKSLELSSMVTGSENGVNRWKSIAILLSEIPKLEYLTLNHDAWLKTSDLKPPALTSLRYFCFEFDKNSVEALAQITQISKNSLKMIELHDFDRDPEGLLQVFEPIKDTLEGLFTTSFVDQIPLILIKFNFSNLRVIRTQCDHHPIPTLYWLGEPMTKNIRTIVTELNDANQAYLLTALGYTLPKDRHKLLNLKHIVFTKYQYTENELDPELTEAYEIFGVQFHVTHPLTADEILELDYKLNGPMK